MIALDTNLLVYAHQPGAPAHRAALKAVERACSDPRGCGIAISSVSEFWCVVTHPAVRSVTAARDAARFLRDLASQGGVVTWVPEAGFGERLAAVAADLGVRGAMIFDLQIALTALENGATQLWTHDARFRSLPGLRVVDPLA